VRNSKSTSADEDVCTEDEKLRTTHARVDEEYILGIDEQRNSCRMPRCRQNKDVKHSFEGTEGDHDDDYALGDDKQRSGFGMPPRRQNKDVKHTFQREERDDNDHDYALGVDARRGMPRHEPKDAPAESLYDGISRRRSKEIDYEDDSSDACMSRAHRDADKTRVPSKTAFSTVCDGAHSESTGARLQHVADETYSNRSSSDLSSKTYLSSSCDAKHDDASKGSRSRRANDESHNNNNNNNRSSVSSSKTQLSLASSDAKHDDCSKDARIRRAKEEAIRSAMSSIDAWGMPQCGV
jgi:hypothetical protein